MSDVLRITLATLILLYGALFFLYSLKTQQNQLEGPVPVTMSFRLFGIPPTLAMGYAAGLLMGWWD